MGYYDLDLSRRRQYDVWWRIEELDEYYRRRGLGDLDIVGYLLEYRCPAEEDADEFRADLAQLAYAFLGDTGRTRFLTGSRDIDWGDDGPLKRSLRDVGDSARQKAFAALYSHNVDFDASISAYRVYNNGKVFDKETCEGFDSLIDDGLVEVDYKYEFNQGVCYRVDITKAGIDYKYGR